MTDIGAPRTLDDRDAVDQGGSLDQGGSNPGGASSAAIAAQLPEPVAALVREGQWQVVAVGSDGSTRWHVTTPTGAVALTVVPAGEAYVQLAAQRGRLAWLAGSLPTTDRPDHPDHPDHPDRPAGTVRGVFADDRRALTVPDVLVSVTDDDSGDGYLATSVVAGTRADGDEHRGDVDALIVALAAGLRSVHALPVESCPFGRTVDQLLDAAAVRVAAGGVDPASLSPPYRRYTPERLLELAVAARPANADDPADLVVVQGRPTMVNTLVEHGRVTGYVDWSGLGVGDRYLDLAVVTRDLAANVSPHALGPFVASYGLEAPDLLKLDFFVLLVELLGLG